jgi:hypothetical protein
MTRCRCRERSGGYFGWGGGHDRCCHDDHEDARWAIPAFGILMALAAAGLLKAHAHGAEQAARVIGFGTLAVCVTAGAALIAWRARRRRAARQRQAVALDAWPPAGQLPGDPGPQAIGSARDGRQAPALPPSRRTRP